MTLLFEDVRQNKIYLDDSMMYEIYIVYDQDEREITRKKSFDEAIQVSSASASVKEEAIKKLNAEYGVFRAEAMTEHGDISDISSSF